MDARFPLPGQVAVEIESNHTTGWVVEDWLLSADNR